MRNAVIGGCLQTIGLCALLLGLTYYWGIQKASSEIIQLSERNLRGLEEIRSQMAVHNRSSDEFAKLSERFKEICEEYKIEHEGFLVMPFFISILTVISGGFYIFCAVSIFWKKPDMRRKILYAALMGILFFSFIAIWTLKEINGIFTTAIIKHLLMSFLHKGAGNAFALYLRGDSSLMQEAIAFFVWSWAIFCLVNFLCLFFYRDNEVLKVKDVV